MLAGFISGLASNNLGLIHGFLTWATGILMIIVIISFTAIGTLSAMGSLFGSVTVNVGESVSTLTSSLGKKIASSINDVSNDLNLINIDNFDEDMTKILKDTKVKELQPGYLKSEIDESINIIKETGKKTLIHPENSEKIINYAVQELKLKAKNIGKSLDKKAIANSVSANTDFTGEEAKQVTDNIYNELEASTKKIENKIEDTSKNLKNVNIYLKSTIDDVKQIANDVAHSTSKASIWAFVAMLLSLIITSLSGWLGSSFSKR